MRVSIIPCEYGEKAVLRILDKSQLRIDLGQIGFQPRQLEVFEEKIALPNGIILVTGPTGSGKTTTLYASLTRLNSPDVNISTVEDPIEYDLRGINQTHIRPEIGLTFAAMLRSILRQDPDIIMVGEIRDRDTLDIALRASLTGHLVLSTLHTNSAAATVSRLVDMGAERPLLASSLRLIVAQRLVRRLCRNCAIEGWNEHQRAAARRLGMRAGNRQLRPGACDRCNQTGYSGRIPIFELLPVGVEVRNAILEEAPEESLTAIAREGGCQSLADSAQGLIRAGVTTPLEALKELST